MVRSIPYSHLTYYKVYQEGNLISSVCQPLGFGSFRTLFSSTLAMPSARGRAFLISQQIARHTLFGTRSGLPTARFLRSYSTAKETTRLNATLISCADDEPGTLPPLKAHDTKMMPMVDHELSPLPEKLLLPPYPSPHLSTSQVQEYLHPLYSRGWGIQVIEKKGPSLSLDLQFSKFQKLCAFLPLLNEIMKKERVSNLVCHSFGLIRL